MTKEDRDEVTCITSLTRDALELVKGQYTLLNFATAMTHKGGGADD